MSCSMRRRRRLRGCRYVWCAPLVRCLHSKTRVVVSTVPKNLPKNLQNFASVQRWSSIGKRPMAPPSASARAVPRVRRPRVVADTDDDVLILSSDLESLPSLPAPPELLEQLPAAFLLRDYVAYFMTGERLMERLRTSDGRLTAINVEWDGPPESAELGSAVAAVELRFSNGMATTPWYQIDGLTSEDVEAVAAEVSQAAEWLGQMGQEVQQHDAEALRLLEKHASCKLTAAEALLLQQSKLCCPICLADFQRNHSILCLPCGRNPDEPDQCSECLGHFAHTKCLRAEFKRRSACPLCRTPLPTQQEPEGFIRAGRNLEYLKTEAKRAAREGLLTGGGGGGGGGMEGEASASGTAVAGLSSSSDGFSSTSKRPSHWFAWSAAAGGGAGAGPLSPGGASSASCCSSSTRSRGGDNGGGSSASGLAIHISPQEQQRQRRAAEQRDDARRWRVARRAARGGALSV